MNKPKAREILLLKKVQQAISTRFPDLTLDLTSLSLGRDQVKVLEVSQSPEKGHMLFFISTDGCIHLENTCEHPIDGTEGIHVSLTSEQVILLGRVADLVNLIVVVAK